MWVIVKAYGGFSVVRQNLGTASPTVDSARLTQAAAVSRRNTLNS